MKVEQEQAQKEAVKKKKKNSQMDSRGPAQPDLSQGLAETISIAICEYFEILIVSALPKSYKMNTKDMKYRDREMKGRGKGRTLRRAALCCVPF